MAIIMRGQTYYRTRDVCEMVGVSRSTLLRWISSGLIRDAATRDRRGWRLFIEADIKRGWHHVTMLLLTVPAQTVTWILRETYIDGEPFTMGDIPMRLEEVKKVLPKRETENQSDGEKDPNRTGTVIPFKKR